MSVGSTALFAPQARQSAPRGLPDGVMNDNGKVTLRTAMFVATMLLCTFDKWGLPIALGGRTISVSPYKLAILTLVSVATFFPARRVSVRQAFDFGLFRAVAAFILLQTLASLAGQVVMPGRIALSSELYYLIQRGTYLMVPWAALRLGVPPRWALGAFFSAILLHDAFVALQYISPASYQAFCQLVADPFKTDNGIDWTRSGSDWFDFIGLQTTSNYGTLVTALGLVALVFRVRTFGVTLAKWTFVIITILIVVLSPSRSVFILGVLSLLVFGYHQRLLVRWQFYVGAIMAATLVTGYLLSSTLPERYAAYAFWDPEREASNDGHLDVALRSFELIQESPLVGYGARRFYDLLVDRQGYDGVAAETHSFFLSVFVAGGLVGLLSQLYVAYVLIGRLWRQGQDSTSAMLAALLVGFIAYNVIYDAGALDVYACFNGVAAYWALSLRRQTPAVRVAQVANQRLYWNPQFSQQKTTGPRSTRPRVLS